MQLVLGLAESLIFLEEVVRIVQPFLVYKSLKSFNGAIMGIKKDLSERAEQGAARASLWAVN